jgi:hypothetical protein
MLRLFFQKRLTQRHCRLIGILLLTCVAISPTFAGESSLPPDPKQHLERTCFQTSQPWSEHGDLGSDVAIAYGIGPGLPDRMQTWREHGYRVHVMTGVAWGNYQDYIEGRFDGVKHDDEIQTDRNGNRHGHGGNVYYMCPGTNYGNFLGAGIEKALEAGAEAIHLEEPEFWVQDGYEEGFKREWKSYYGEDWQPPHSSVDAQWRASKLKYFLYRRALQQVFDYVLDYNKRTGRHVRCYVPTHSLLNYAQWKIVSPESSLARLNGCDGYIAQVWTGTSRTPNFYRGVFRERTFETAFLEYGAMQNLVRSTGRTVWYLNDPVEDNPGHDWKDYQSNWESTLVASLFQPEVSKYEVAPWPERVFGGRYPRRGPRESRMSIPPAYATELQTVMRALNDMDQKQIDWDCGTAGIGVLVSDSLMFERGDPTPSDLHLGHVYGLALPFLKRGMPVTPVQLENVGIEHYLDGFRLLLLSYRGMKPLDATVHTALAKWVKGGGALVVCDDDRDPYNAVRDWWNSGAMKYATPREHLFEQLGLKGETSEMNRVGKGVVIWLRENPAAFAASAEAESQLANVVKRAAEEVHLKWRETNYLLLRRGPYVIAARLDESPASGSKELQGKFINLFDSELNVQTNLTITSGSRYLLLDLQKIRGRDTSVLAAACKIVESKRTSEAGRGVLTAPSYIVEGVGGTEAVVLFRVPPGTNPSAELAGGTITNLNYNASEHLAWIRFANESKPRELSVRLK